MNEVPTLEIPALEVPTLEIPVLEIPMMQLPHAEGMALPRFATKGSSGLDLSAAIEDSLSLAPLERSLIPTGIALALPPSYEAQIRPRSGLALRYGVTCLNSPGTIDSDYRGEIKILLVNLGQDVFTIKRADRIAQMVVARVVSIGWRLCTRLEETQRGEGGFASTGIQAVENSADD